MQLLLFVPGASLLRGRIRVNESHDFPNFRDYYYSDEDVIGMAVSVEVLGAQEHFAAFYFMGCVRV